MRILKLRFANLNSLVGEWQIDFTASAYTDNGIFAITGATGAGKSTILDAICLALYGATPRLGDITKSKNDLMSRHTLDCFSEVIFATQTGSYRCQWTQRRAKKTGTLQAPKHEIAEYLDADKDGKIIEEKATRTKQKVEEITGMDFYRFTRAMLLAQGSFAAFLQASSDERSPILEQITGTEIYSEISKKVHEFKTTSDNDLKSAQAKLSGMSILSSQEEQALIEQQDKLQTQLNNTNLKIDNLDADKVWQTSLSDCRAQIAILSQQKLDLQKKITEFAPQQIRLQRATKALTLSAPATELSLMTKQLTQQTQDLANLEQQRPTLRAHYQMAERQLADDYTTLQTAENALLIAQPLLNQVRELDSQRQQQQQQLQEINASIQALNQQISKNNLALTQQKQQQQHYQKQQQQLLSEQQANPNVDEMTKTLAILPELNTTLATLEQEKVNLTAEHQQLQQQHENDKKQAQIFLQNLSGLEHELTAAKAEQQALEQTLNHLSDGQSITALRQSHEQLWLQQNHVTAIKHALDEWQHNYHQYLEHQKAYAQATTQLTALEQRLQQVSNDYQHTQQQVETLEQNVQLLNQIEDFTQRRQHLIHGEPCPLCGSTEHPFVKDPTVTQQASQSRQKLSDTKYQLSQLEAALRHLGIEQNNCVNRQQFLQQQNAQLAQKNQQLIQRIDSDLSALPNAQALSQTWHTLRSHSNNAQSSLANAKLDISIQNIKQNTNDFSHQLGRYDQGISEQSTLLQQRLADFEAQQNAYHTLQKHIASLSERYNQQHNQQTTLSSRQQRDIERIEQLYHLLTANAEHTSHLQQRITGLLLPFNAQLSLHFSTDIALNQQAVGGYIDRLQQHCDDVRQCEQRLATLTEQINKTHTNLASLSSQQQSLTAQLQQAQQKQQSVTATLQQLTEERWQKFGDKTINAEENRLNDAKNQAFDTWRASEHALNQLTQRLTLINTQIDNLTTRIDQLQTSQHDLQQQLHKRLVAVGFLDYADFESANLSDHEREQLQQAANQLSEQQQRNDSLLQQAKAQEQHLLASPRSELSLAQIMASLNTEQQTLSQLQQAFGAVEQSIKANQQLKATQANLIAIIEQKAQYAKEWKDLHDLIGSSDGKKFRNFAQGLTFNIMINHANEQLKKMSDRYLLLADRKEPLMLNVLDNYQGGEIRTSKNLSGGESFIISLALALGLSNMASHRMQVDSLFLDEGFGTLDEDALDTALDTLTTLQQSGKLIGVISHIQALKDRISNQIQVVPQTGGVSKISGAGVSKIA